MGFLNAGLLPRLLAISLFLLLLAPPLAAEELTNEDCAECHSEEDEDTPLITAEHLLGSLHEDFDCMDCHFSITELPHDEIEFEPVFCGECHEEAAEAYTKHGFGIVGESTEIPTCVDCHGTHGILSHEDEKSPVHPLNLPNTCAACHEDDAFTEEQGIRFKHPVGVYSRSVHGRATLTGDQNAAATCNDCHSTGGSAHRILGPGDPESTINHFNIAMTCAKCHEFIGADYMEGIHGDLMTRGQVNSPTCTTCHGEHNILSTNDPRSPVSSSRLAEATCAPCHESAALNEKYDLPTGRLRSFRDSYHGLKSKAGDASVANCGSCHGTHRILPAADPSSAVHPENLQRTCGECHPKISATIAQIPIHSLESKKDEGIAGIVKMVYLIAIFVIIGSMALHWLIDLHHQVRVVMFKKKQVRRMDGDEVVQHFILALSFTILVVSGFSLRFYDAWWSKWLFGWEGGYTFRGELHRISGVILMLASVWHGIFLITPRGRAFLKDMWPRWDDFKEFLHMNAYNLSIRKDHPQFGRFSYVEKAEYWALLWGTVVMAITGIMLWFDYIFADLVPKGVLDVMLVIHYYEAWLAFLAILIWHMYSTVFRPSVYPMNPSWLTGTMPEEQFIAEHPKAAAASNIESMQMSRDEKAAKKGKKD